YVNQGSQPAFAAIVQRYTDLVYSAALRQVRDRHLAEDVTQAVFVVLARRAKSIRDSVALSAWLLTTTRNASWDALRRQSRTRRREAEAAAMRSEFNQVSKANEVDGELDAAFASLSQSDRNAV